MSLTLPTVTGTSFSMVVKPSILNPLTDTIPAVVPFNFASVANLKTFSGSYTPANDTFTIASGLTLISPNFFVLFVDGLVNFADLGEFFLEIPIKNFMASFMPPLVGGAHPITGFIFDGRTSLPYPMAQGVTINYTLICGQAVIT